MAKRERVVEDGNDIESFLDRMKTALLIDKHGLDMEWVSQPGLFLEIADRLALEISVRDEAKDMLKDIEAEIDAEVRLAYSDDEEEDPKKKKKKPTETAIKNEVAADKHVIKAKSVLRTHERNVGFLAARKEAFNMRRYALQDLTSLHLGGYYQSNSGAARGAREATHDSSRKAMQDVRAKQRKSNKED